MTQQKSPPKIVDDPLFRSDGGALMFALNHAHGTVKKPGLTSLMGGGATGKGLGGLDGAAQAGMLLSQMDWLRKHRKAILIARFALPRIQCGCGQTCCRGYRENPEWAAAVGEVTEHILFAGVVDTISHYRVRRAMVMRHFGEKVNFTDMSKLAKISRNTASDQYAKVAKHLKTEEQRARWEFEGILKVEGIIE